MGFKETLENNSYWVMSGIAVSAFVAGYLCCSALDERANKNFDRVAKNTYAFKDEIDKNYVSKSVADSCKSELNKCLRLQDKVTAQPVVTLEIFPNDSIDQYGIYITKSDNYDSEILKLCTSLHDYGCDKALIFKDDAGTFNLIIYGYAIVGKGMNSDIQKWSKVLNEKIRKKFLLKSVYLQNYAARGFVPYFDERKIFRYFQPKK